jgi:DEAD/DEAH box helicase domain-containing protein
LENLGRSTLNAPKSADGLQALKWWKEGKVAEIAKYCEQDVSITRDIYRAGRDNGYLLFTNKAGQKVRIPVAWP